MNEDKGVFVSDNFFFKISNGILSTEVVSLYLCWSLGSDFIFVYLLFVIKRNVINESTPSGHGEWCAGHGPPS